MNEADRIAEAYAPLLSGRAAARWDSRNRGNQAIVSERRQLLTRLLGERGFMPLGERRVLDVGSGGGGELAWLVTSGASVDHLVGVDLLPQRVQAARAANPGIDFRVGNAENLDFPDASFDLVLAFTLFTSILDPTMTRRVADEIQRVLRPGGGLVWYDFRYPSPNNKDVRAVRAADVRRMFPLLEGKLHSITLLPPIARRLGPLTGPVYPLLAGLPPLRSHLLGILLKPLAL